MIRVSFFIKDIHAGTVLTAMDKIAIDLAMTPVKDKAIGQPSDRGKRREVAAQIISKMPGPFSPPELSKLMLAAGFDVKNMSGFIKSLIKNGVVKKLPSGKYNAKVVK